MRRDRVKEEENFNIFNGEKDFDDHDLQQDEEEISDAGEEKIRDTSKEVKFTGKKKLSKEAKLFGLLCIVLIFVFTAVSPMASKNNRYELSSEEIETGICNSIEPGKLINALSENEKSRDFNIENKSDEESTKMIVWDYADEDGDYIQLYSDGNPISDIFMIKNKPIEIEVPASGIIEVKGVKDGAGGITYALKCGLNGLTYINSTKEGVTNKYTFY